MGFWDTDKGYATGDAICELAMLSRRSKTAKYDAPMRVKTFVFRYDFNMDTGDIPDADAEISEFIKDKLVIDIKANRLDESHMTYIVLYKIIQEG